MKFCEENEENIFVEENVCEESEESEENEALFESEKQKLLTFLSNKDKGETIEALLSKGFSEDLIKKANPPK